MDAGERFAERLRLRVAAGVAEDEDENELLLRDLSKHLPKADPLERFYFLLDQGPEACVYFIERVLPPECHGYDMAMATWTGATLEEEEQWENRDVVAAIFQRLLRDDDSTGGRVTSCMMQALQHWAIAGPRGCAMIDHICRTCGEDAIRSRLHPSNLFDGVGFESWIHEWCEHCADRVLPYDRVSLDDVSAISNGVLHVTNRKCNARFLKLLEATLRMPELPDHLWCLILALYAGDDAVYAVLLAARQAREVKFRFKDIVHRFGNYFGSMNPGTVRLRRWLDYVPTREPNYATFSSLLGNHTVNRTLLALPAGSVDISDVTQKQLVECPMLYTLLPHDPTKLLVLLMRVCPGNRPLGKLRPWLLERIDPMLMSDESISTFLWRTPRKKAVAALRAAVKWRTATPLLLGMRDLGSALSLVDTHTLERILQSM